MISRLRILATAFALLVTASVLAGCSFDPGERTQLVGQECFSDDQCVPGAVCVERRCQYEASGLPGDAGFEDAHPDAPDAEPTDVPPGTDDVPPGTDAEFMDVAVDGGGGAACRPGATRCIDNFRLAYCRDDGTSFETRTCEDGLRCTEGACVPVDQSVCQFQDQPCDEEGFSNGYYCADISGGDDEMRCLGVCDNTADDPNSTCPQAGSVCTFGDEDGGVCLSGCNLDEGCSAPGYGCLPYDGQANEGICVPTNPTHEIGDRCNSDNFFDCEEGAICIDIQNGARCVEACRAFTGGAGSDCDSGHCMPLTDTIGMCRPDAGNRTEGEECPQPHTYRTCGEDAVVCAPRGGWQDLHCTRFCRLQEGSTDCSGQQSCVPYDEQRDDLGVCR